MRCPAAVLCAVPLFLLTAASCVGDAPSPIPPDGGRPAAAVPASSHGPGSGMGQDLPPGHPPARAADAVPPVPHGAGTGAAALTWTVPGGWKAEPPSSSMRRAQYRVPGAGGDAECVVFYFGPGQGGDAMANAARWAGQFRQPAGRDPVSTMKTSELDMGGLKVTMVEIEGTYSGGMGSAAGARPGYALLGAIAAGPDANWFFKLTGPETTVAAQRAAFAAMVRSLKRGS